MRTQIIETGSAESTKTNFTTRGLLVNNQSPPANKLFYQSELYIFLKSFHLVVLYIDISVCCKTIKVTGIAYA